MNLMKHGRKWLALALNTAGVFLILSLSFYLALRDKLTPDWSSLCQILIGALTASTAAFMAANAYNTGKTIDATGEPPPPPEGV
jgi:flagellar biosynthesis protein FliR